ncbi:MAG: thioredoxin family protein [Chloroflexota bacterium]
MSDFPINRSNWQQGLTVEHFLDSMTQHQQAMRRRMETVRLRDEDIQRLGNMKNPRYLAIMTEDWCSDCLMVLPILTRIAEAAANMEVRIFVRRDWQALRGYYHGQDIPSIPVATFMDEDFQPLATWIERPRAGHERLAAWKTAHPEVELTRKRADLSAEEKRELLKDILDQLLVEMEQWYAEDLQSETVREVTELMGLGESCCSA